MRRMIQSIMFVFVCLLGATVHAQTAGSTVSGEPPQYFTGVIPPPRAQLAIRAQVQAQVATKTEQGLTKLPVQAPALSRPFGDVRDQCSVEAKAFDYRQFGVISNVRDQKTCGSCAIFAAVAAFEASWAILNNAEQLDVSEQHLLNCAGAATCNGGWHEKVFEYLTKPGGTSEGNQPYIAQSSGCQQSGAPTYTAVNWSYVNPDASTPSTAVIKRALCDRGPIVVAMLATPAFQKYLKEPPGDIFDEGAEGFGATDVNHDVLIVGWDDNKGAWLIKNSWTEGWGDKGFGWVKYKTNNIGYGAAWVQAFKKPSVASPADLTGEIRRTKQVTKQAEREVIQEQLGRPSARNREESIEQALERTAPALYRKGMMVK
jgi:C1A family cysteine protease